MSLRRWLIVGPSFVFAFVVNPAYFAGCGSAEQPTFTFGEQDMLKLLHAVNDAAPLEFSAAGGDYTLELSLMQKLGDDRDDTVARSRSAWAGTVYACGTRTFLQSASACITSSELPVTGTVTLLKKGDNALPAELAVSGTLRVYGYDLKTASLDLNDPADTISLQSTDARTFRLTVFDAPKLGDGGSDIQFMQP